MTDAVLADRIAEGILAYLRRHSLLRLLPQLIRRLQPDINSNRIPRVYSAAVLSAQDRGRVIKALSTRFPDLPAPEFLIDPQLIGGLCIYIGDKVLDLSISARLQDLYARL